MTRELHDVRLMLRSLRELRADSAALSRELTGLARALEEGRWLDQGEAVHLAEQLRRFSLSQQILQVWTEQNLGQGFSSMAEVQTPLKQREQALAAREQLLRPCLEFLALETGVESLKAPLAARQEALRLVLEEDGDLDRWSHGCGALLEQLTARDYSRIDALAAEYQDLFGLPVVTGVYSGAIFAPAEDTEASEPAPAEDAEAPEPAPAEDTEAPEPAPAEDLEAPEPAPAEDTEASEPAPAEEAAFWPGAPAAPETGCLTFAGSRRAETPSGKKFQDLFRRADFREIYYKLRTCLVFTGEEQREHPDFPDGALSQAVREGYVTQAAAPDGRQFFFASPKLLASMRKASVQRCLDHHGTHPITDALEEESLTPTLLEQPQSVYRALKCLYDDRRLRNWRLVRLCKWQDQVCYETYIRFETDGMEPVFCRLVALTDPGADHRAAFLARLAAFLSERSEPVWAVVPSREEIPRWREYFTARDLPVPSWLPLDAPGLLFSPEGEASQLPELFLTVPLEESTPVAVEEPQPVEEPAPEVIEEPQPAEKPAPEVIEEPQPAEKPAPEAVEEPQPVEEPAPEAVEEPQPAEKPAPEAVEEPQPAEKPAPEAVEEPQPVEEPAPEAVEEPQPVEEPAPEAVEEPQPMEEPAPETVEEPQPMEEPAWTHTGLFALRADPEKLWRQAVEWFAGGEHQLGLCLLRVLQDLAPCMAPRCLPYAYALDDPAEQCHYLPDRLTQVYAVAGSGLDGDALGCLSLSAHLRMAFTAEAGQAWYQAADALQSMAAGPAVEALPSARSALELLARTLRERRRGFEPQLIRQCQMWGETQQKLEELSRAARDLRDGRRDRVDVYTNRIKKLFDVLFGPQSQLMECLAIVEQADTTRRDRVRELYASLLGGDGRPDQRAITKYIDRVWDEQPSKYKQKEPLKSKARSLAFSRFHTCLDLCAQWLECADTAAIGQSEAEQILKARDRLLELFQSARGEWTAAGGLQRHSAGAVLNFTLDELIRSLNGEPVDRWTFYADFLRTGQVELTEDLLPVLEPAEYIIPGFEPWRRLAEHRRRMNAGEGAGWDSVLERIWSGERSAPDCYNFGAARCIERLADRQGMRLELLERADIDADIRKVTALVEDEELQFRARLELAATYGQIEDHARKERLSNTVTEALRPHYQDSGNWGFYLRAMEACLAAVQRDAERLEPRYRYEFDRLKETVPPCPMFDKIEQLLREKMFSVAHDYMQLVVREGVTVPPESSVLRKDPGSDHLLRFLRDYAPLSRLCMEERGQGRTLEHIYNQFAGDAGQDKNSTKRTARLMIRAWPKSNNTTPEMVQELLLHLAFPVRRVLRGSDPNAFTAEMEPAPTHVYTHPHPIAAFGTQLSHTGLNVRVLSGRKTAEELVDLINRLGRTDVPTLFLLDYALPLPERNAMARKLKRESAHLSTCLVLDRVLALFLTGFPDAERGKVLLQCGMPFHFYNPYVKGDTPIPPEMFMGREAQLEEILRNGGANIIYGGRQLGKTALLRRAAGLVDDPEKGQWAVYTDVLYRCDYPEALEKLYACLTACGFLNATSTSPQSWEELCARIRQRMDDPARRVERFLLLMDEADQFLSSSGACSYRPVECLHQLQTATGGRFKYVLAGLHNVMRFSREATRNNSILGKLGALTIKPLTYQEASQLLEEPLYYLGFRMDSEQNVLLSQILLSTNYYPGLIHFYCAQLVESLCSGMDAAEPCPPYRLDENQIRVLLQKKDFTSQIRDKFFITLDVEEDKLYYRILAYALAYCYYDQPEHTVEGYTFQDIRGVCQDFSISSITGLEPASVEVLLSEMEELNVLVCMNGRYAFNGANFRHMMGDYETVFDELDRFSEEVE